MKRVGQDHCSEFCCCLFDRFDECDECETDFEANSEQQNQSLVILSSVSLQSQPSFAGMLPPDGSAPSQSSLPQAEPSAMDDSPYLPTGDQVASYETLDQDQEAPHPEVVEIRPLPNQESAEEHMPVAGPVSALAEDTPQIFSGQEYVVTMNVQPEGEPSVEKQQQQSGAPTSLPEASVSQPIFPRPESSPIRNPRAPAKKLSSIERTIAAIKARTQPSSSSKAKASPTDSAQIPTNTSATEIISRPQSASGDKRHSAKETARNVLKLIQSKPQGNRSQPNNPATISLAANAMPEQSKTNEPPCGKPTKVEVSPQKPDVDVEKQQQSQCTKQPTSGLEGASSKSAGEVSGGRTAVVEKPNKAVTADKHPTRSEREQPTSSEVDKTRREVHTISDVNKPSPSSSHQRQPQKGSHEPLPIAQKAKNQQSPSFWNIPRDKIPSGKDQYQSTKTSVNNTTKTGVAVDVQIPTRQESDHKPSAEVRPNLVGQTNETAAQEKSDSSVQTRTVPTTENPATVRHVYATRNHGRNQTQKADPGTKSSATTSQALTGKSPAKSVETSTVRTIDVVSTQSHTLGTSQTRENVRVATKDTSREVIYSRKPGSVLSEETRNARAGEKLTLTLTKTSQKSGSDVWTAEAKKIAGNKAVQSSHGRISDSKRANKHKKVTPDGKASSNGNDVAPPEETNQPTGQATQVLLNYRRQPLGQKRIIVSSPIRGSHTHTRTKTTGAAPVRSTSIYDYNERDTGDEEETNDVSPHLETNPEKKQLKECKVHLKGIPRETLAELNTGSMMVSSTNGREDDKGEQKETNVQLNPARGSKKRKARLRRNQLLEKSNAKKIRGADTDDGGLVPQNSGKDQANEKNRNGSSRDADTTNVHSEKTETRNGMVTESQTAEKTTAIHSTKKPVTTTLAPEATRATTLSTSGSQTASQVKKTSSQQQHKRTGSEITAEKPTTTSSSHFSPHQWGSGTSAFQRTGKLPGMSTFATRPVSGPIYAPQTVIGGTLKQRSDIDAAITMMAMHPKGQPKGTQPDVPSPPTPSRSVTATQETLDFRR